MKTKNMKSVSTIIAVTIAVSILVAFSATASAATTWYVSTTGDDTSGGGSAVTPWKTITYALTQVSAGDTIIVEPGTYVEYTGTPSAGVAVKIPWYAEGAGGLTIQSSDGPESTIIDCGWAGWGVQMNSNDITFDGFTVKNAYNLINQVSGNDHNLNNLILTDFVNYGMSVLAAHDCTFRDITIHTNDVSKSADRTVKGIDMQEYGSGGNTYNTFEDITIYDIETTETYGTSMGIFFEGDNPDTHPTTGNTFTNVDIYNLASEYFNCGVYILDNGYYTGTGHMNPYAIEDTTFCGGNIYGFTENGADVVSRGFYVKGGNENLDITCFDITDCDEGVYFKGFDWVQPPTFPPTGWINDDSWVASKGNWMVSPRTGSYAAGIEICTSTPNDYLIMPQQSISSGDSVSFYAHGTHFSGTVRFQLKVSTTGTDPTDFTDTIDTFTVPIATESWLLVSKDLSAYNGQDIYIAIYAYESTGGPSSELLIDDVTLPDASTEGFEGTPVTIGAVEVTVNCNNIHGNTNYGVDNSNGVGTIDAKCNWWGDDSGPTHSSNSGGSGDAVSDNVDFDPWIGITELSGPTEPIKLDDPASIDLSFTCNKGTATLKWDDGTQVTYSTESKTTTESHTYSKPGVYTVTLTIEDCCGRSYSREFRYVVVYDPSAGFVTGGGWIYSEAGAYVPDPDAEGKANFGFVSKYKKGQTTPTGNTEFQFKAGDLNFHSDNYDWLVIAGSKAMYKGTGTINGEGSYKFMLSAIDGDLNGDGVDKFRIKIWEEDTNGDETIIYDNGEGIGDGETLTELGGGQIVIHKKKAK